MGKGSCGALDLWTALCFGLIIISWLFNGTQIFVPHDSTRYHTQLVLKQSCEQNELSIPSFKHVGHCKDPAAFEQSTPSHFFFSAAAGAILIAHVWILLAASEGQYETELSPLFKKDPEQDLGNPRQKNSMKCPLGMDYLQAILARVLYRSKMKKSQSRRGLCQAFVRAEAR